MFNLVLYTYFFKNLPVYYLYQCSLFPFMDSSDCLMTVYFSQKIPFSVPCRADLLAINFLSFCLFGKSYRKNRGSHNSLAKM